MSWFRNACAVCEVHPLPKGRERRFQESGWLFLARIVDMFKDVARLAFQLGAEGVERFESHAAHFAVAGKGA